MKTIPDIEKLFDEEEYWLPYKYRRPYFMKKEIEVFVQEPPAAPFMDERYLEMACDAMISEMAGNLKEIAQKRKMAPRVCKDEKVLSETMRNAGALARARRHK